MPEVFREGKCESWAWKPGLSGPAPRAVTSFHSCLLRPCLGPDFVLWTGVHVLGTCLLPSALPDTLSYHGITTLSLAQCCAVVGDPCQSGLPSAPTPGISAPLPCPSKPQEGQSHRPELEMPKYSSPFRMWYMTVVCSATVGSSASTAVSWKTEVPVERESRGCSLVTASATPFPDGCPLNPPPPGP